MKYGYARVSSRAQEYTAQVEALKAAGCERIFSEKASGKSTNGRPEFAKLLKALLPGDTVVVTKLDGLARWEYGVGVGTIWRALNPFEASVSV
jgi:DNA invertase Pin-like site-specific DNA recombinase